MDRRCGSSKAARARRLADELAWLCVQHSRFAHNFAAHGPGNLPHSQLCKDRVRCSRTYPVGDEARRMSPTPTQPVAQGTLANTPFAHLVLYIYQRRSSGTLVVRDLVGGPRMAPRSGGEPIA